MSILDRIALALWRALEPRLRRSIAEACRAAAVRTHGPASAALLVLAEELERP